MSIITLADSASVRDVAQLGSASGSGPEGRGFESHRSDHSKDNEMIPKIISFLLYLGAFLIDLIIQKIPEQTKMFIIISARKVRVAYR